MAPYVFFLSYARDDDSPELERFVADLSEEIRGRLGLGKKDPVCFRDEQGIEPGTEWREELEAALSSARAFVSLYSPRYFERPPCGQEWAVFRHRLARAAAGGPLPPLILPVLWIPLGKRFDQLPELVRAVQFSHAELGDRYSTEGLRYLLKPGKDKEEAYGEFLARFAQKLERGIEDHPLAPVVPPLRLADFPDLFARPSVVTEAAAPRRAVRLADLSEWRDGRDRRERGPDFLDQVERALRLREAPIEIERAQGTGTLGDHLLVKVLDLGFPRVFPAAAVERGMSEALLWQFLDEIVAPYRFQDPNASALLVYGGEPAPEELAREAGSRRVRLVRWADYQRMIDFAGYLARQTADLENEVGYPSRLYVPQRMIAELGTEGRTVEDALAEIRGWLDDDKGHFVLVLGDFGTGKTFLLYELARRMALEPAGPAPILLTMRALEKAHSLDTLLSQHFTAKGFADVSLRKLHYLLEQGLAALLFDGFDELELRVTYPRAAEHFDTLLEAAAGQAKVVVTSRKQHFLTDGQVRTALLDRVEPLQGRRIVTLQPFDKARIRQFLIRHCGNESQADRRMELLDRVKDLMSLSHNPRLLGFIAELPEEDLNRAAAHTGEITAAGLYQILLDRWLQSEHDRIHVKGAPPGLALAARWGAVTALALRLWEKTDRFADLSEISEEAGRIVRELQQEHLSAEGAAFQIGSGTLFVRDEVGRFSFLHQSILEWLVARQAAAELKTSAEAKALSRKEMSLLMTEFLCDLAGKELAVGWALQVFAGGGGEVAQKNANQILRWLNVRIQKPLQMAGQNLRGQDFSGQVLDDADFSGADLSEAILAGAVLQRADLRETKLVGADLERAVLAGADLTGADLSTARLLGADLRRAKLERAVLRRAKLIGALWEPGALAGCDRFGAALELDESFRAFPPGSLECNAVAWSPEGTLAASGWGDGSVRIVEVSSGRELRRLQGHESGVWSVAFSPVGEQLASGSSDKTVRLWEVSSGRELQRLQGHKDMVLSVAFSPGGEQLASGSSDKTVRLWEVSSGRELRRLQGHENGVQSVAFSPVGEQLASGSSDKTVRLWEVSSGRELRRLQGHENGVQSVAFSPAGEQLASGSSDKTVRLWEVSSGRELRRLQGHKNGVQSVVFSLAGEQLASGSSDSTVRLWEVNSGRELRRFQGHEKGVRSVAFSPAGEQLASGSNDNTVRFWEVSSGRELRRFQGYQNWIRSLAWSLTGEQLASGAYDKTVRLWEVSSGRELRRLQGHQTGVRSVAWSPTGEQLASGADDNTVRLWEVSSGRELRQLQGHENGVQSVAWSPTGEQLASGADDNTVRLWEVSSGRELRRLQGHQSGVQGVAFSPGGEQLASGSSDKTVRLWEVSSGRELRRLQGHENGVQSVVFSPGGEQLASGSSDKTVRLWEVSSGRELRRLQGHENWVRSVAFSPGGERLASGSSDKTVRLWEVSSGRELRRLQGHENWVQSVAFSPGGKHLASASSDGTIRLWEVATGRCLAVLAALPEGWVAFSPDGRYKLGGIPAGGFWHAIQLCRFEPGELDPYVPGLRLADDASFLDLPPWTPRAVGGEEGL